MSALLEAARALLARAWEPTVSIRTLSQAEADAEAALRKAVAAASAPPTPEAVGAQIRALLLSLRDPSHDPAKDAAGQNSYATDALRRRALDLAGFCWLAPGEMAPRCVCGWSPADPSAPRRRLFTLLADALDGHVDHERANAFRAHGDAR